MSTEKNMNLKSLEERFGPMTVGMFLRAFREADDVSQTDFAKKLKISRANLCDLEKERKLVSPERAARFAKALKVPEMALVQLSLRDLLRASKLNYDVEIFKAS
jgi:transcriptional regulator with XRE-family HTH domain